MSWFNTIFWQSTKWYDKQICLPVAYFCDGLTKKKKKKERTESENETADSETDKMIRKLFSKKLYVNHKFVNDIRVS